MTSKHDDSNVGPKETMVIDFLWESVRLVSYTILIAMGAKKALGRQWWPILQQAGQVVKWPSPNDGCDEVSCRSPNRVDKQELWKEPSVDTAILNGHRTFSPNSPENELLVKKYRNALQCLQVAIYSTGQQVSSEDLTTDTEASEQREARKQRRASNLRERIRRKDITMATSERINKDIDGIFKMLKLSEKAVPKILARRKIKELERTLKSIEEQRDEAHRLKTNAQMLMFKEEMKIKQDEEQQAAAEREKEEQEKRNAKYEEELKLERMKLEMRKMRMNFDGKTIGTNKGQEVKVKLPKLAKVFIEGLPFTSEGYERTKSILKTKYGKPSEVANAQIQAIMSLPIIHQCNVQKVHEFYEKLTTNVQSLETMGKLKEINGYVRLTLDKLPSIRADLVKLDDDWQEKQEPKRESLLHTKQGEYKPRKCIYCDEENHKAAGCKKINKFEERRRIVSDRKLCFNCTGSGHRAVNCPSRIRCQHCKNKHHTSLCSKVTRTPSLATTQDPVIYPTVMVQVNGVKCLALLDIGAGSSYASNILINRLSMKPKKTEVKRIEMMLHTSKKKIEIFNVTISSLDETFTINIEVSKIEKSALLSIPNPRFSDLKKNYRHLKNVYIAGYHAKEEVPVHLILGASDFARIKTRTAPRIGSSGEPVAELTKLGWTIISVDLRNLYLTRSSSEDYERLCALDVLGLKEASCGNHNEVYQKFKNQLTKDPEGWHETGLLWKTDGLPETNKQGSLGRLYNLLSKRKKKPGLLKEYNEIMVKQLSEGIIEKVICEAVSGKEFYLPHRPVVREQAETTKVRIVYDASGRPDDGSPSLNDSLETGLPLQNLLWNIIVRNKFKSVSLCRETSLLANKNQKGR
ncbi:uncharacterized protein LOC130636888 [Hydractinia symbiolongicarpus]|uniref:uncharacterized protein LOC130636888 n=1 Tax=Hydractinia symbiolongicarpus TaxID=13093 RepID=UPI00254E3036|nr:uncharacterized protein LOC130636888 [Hydractinia symbiolongicarpus]